MKKTMTAYKVRAVPWKHGWELHIEGVGVTQSDNLRDADQEVRDYLESLLDIDASDVEIDTALDLHGLDVAARQAMADAARVQREQEEIARRKREIVSELREAGVRRDDIAQILGVSGGRVSQILANA